MKMKPPKSIPDQIYEYLMESIQTGEIMDGERLIETKVAEALQISRTPVREAFRRLEQDGIVERLPQGGVRVVPITSAMIEELFGIRGVLEAYAADLACERITPEAIEELERIKQLALSAIDNRDLPRDQKMKQLFELNTMFHDVIYQATDSDHLIRLINTLRHLVLRLRSMSIRKDSAWRTVWDDHIQLIGHLKNHDPKGAGELMKEHIRRAAHDASLFASDSPDQ